MVKKRISILTTKWGHLSIANAIKDSIQSQHYDICINKIDIDNSLSNLYEIVYTFFPNAQKLPFKLSNKKLVKNFLYDYFNKNYERIILDIIKDKKPDYVINTYFAFNFILEDIVNKYSFDLINPIANPRTFSGVEVINKGYNLVFDNKDKERCLDYGIEDKKVIETGWFVRKEFYDKKDKSYIREKLMIPEDKFILTVVAGSVGTNAILKILPLAAKTIKGVHIIFICGKNKQLFTTIKALTQLFHLDSDRNDCFTVLGFKENINEYLAASNLIIGKAGPNTIFESVATETPFFAISHIAGQEDGNLEIIEDYNIGYVEERPSKAVKKLREICNQPEVLEKFREDLKSLANFNNKSGERLSDLIGLVDS